MIRKIQLPIDFSPKMKFYCHILSGALYLPNTPAYLEGLTFLSITSQKGAILTKNIKGILITDKKNDKAIEYFIFCYQFLFPNSYVYHEYSKADDFFEIEANDFNVAVDQINVKYTSSKEPFLKDFNFEEPGRFCTQLPFDIQWQNFYSTFIEAYKKNEIFRNVIDLLLFTIGSHHRVYDNLFQKISQLQTIFETLIGKPTEKKCETCKRNHYTKEWKDFITEQLENLGVSDPQDIDLIVSIKNTLNKSSRIQFVHYAYQYNIPQERIKGIVEKKHTVSDENRDIKSILSTPHRNWTPLNWQNIFLVYTNIIRLIIVKKYNLTD